ncbi:MAG: MFS transporter [Betaproteobacteria bacterium]|nr:MFS transporter [Betaproteobacteria bacterium]
MMRLILPLCILVHACYIGSKIVVSLLAIELGASQAIVGLLAALYGVAPLLLGVHSGRFSDTVGTRPPLLIGAGLVALAMLTGYLFQSIASLIVVTTLLGMGFVYYNVAIQNFTGSYGPVEHRARNLSWLSMAYSVSAFIGPVFGGYMIDHFGHAAAFLGFAAFAGVALIVLGVNRRFGTPAAAPAGGAARSMSELLRNPPLRRVVIMSGLMVSAWELYLFYMPLHGISIGLNASTIGLVLGVYAAAAFVVRFLLPLILRHVSMVHLLSVSMVTAAAVFVGLPWVKVVWLLIAASFTIGLLLGLCQPVMMTLSFERSPAGRTGEVTGLRLTANNIARIVVPVISGALGAASGAAPVFWMNAVNLAAIGWLARR